MRKRCCRITMVTLVAACVGLLAGCAWFSRSPEIPAKKITLGPLFKDGMVLQREMEVPVWGWCEPGRTVNVELFNQNVSAVADQAGRWQVSFKPMKACGPLIMKVKGKSTIMINDVMIGEVWICSGQSNMQWPMSRVENAEKEIKNSNIPRLRLFTVPLKSLDQAQSDCGGKWAECSPAAVKNFSGVGYFFGRRLQHDLNMAVGLIMVAWGGTRIEAWMPRDLLERDVRFRDCVTKYQEALKDYPAGMENYRRILEKKKQFKPTGALPERHADPGNRGYEHGWARSETDLASWRTVKVPTTFSVFGGINGAVWFRREVSVPADWSGQDLVLELGPIDDCDTTYVNNVKVGGIGTETPHFWDTPRRYTVPGKLVKTGNNVIAVRIFDQYANGGFMGTPGEMKIYPAGLPAKAIALDGEWKAKVELELYPFQLKSGGEIAMPLGPGHRNVPGGLWNAMVKPLIPYSIRGVIWYQGESNSSSPALYRLLLPEMIKAWRQGWGYDFAFLIVQLPNFMQQWPAPQESKWAEVREAQMEAAGLPGVACVVTIDLGVEDDIHPRNKLDVGVRLALMAEGTVYSKKFLASKEFVYTGPVVDQVKIVGSKVVLTFKHVGHGLISKDKNRLRHFAIAGKDGKFCWANADIKGDTVEVWSGNVKAPTAVRYAWADNPAGVNFYNRDGFPAAPFRTLRPEPAAKEDKKVESKNVDIKPVSGDAAKNQVPPKPVMEKPAPAVIAPKIPEQTKPVLEKMAPAVIAPKVPEQPKPALEKPAPAVIVPTVPEQPKPALEKSAPAVIVPTVPEHPKPVSEKSALTVPPQPVKPVVPPEVKETTTRESMVVRPAVPLASRIDDSKETVPVKNVTATASEIKTSAVKVREVRNPEQFYNTTRKRAAVINVIPPPAADPVR